MPLSSTIVVYLTTAMHLLRQLSNPSPRLQAFLEMPWTGDGSLGGDLPDLSCAACAR